MTIPNFQLGSTISRASENLLSMLALLTLFFKKKSTVPLSFIKKKERKNTYYEHLDMVTNPHPPKEDKTYSSSVEDKTYSCSVQGLPHACSAQQNRLAHPNVSRTVPVFFCGV
jgi:hypothetical protein